MDGFSTVGRVDEIPPGSARVVRINDKPIAIFNIRGTFYAIHNTCPHEGGPLAKGHVKGHVVTCPWHDLAFDVRNGFGTDGGGYCVGSYEVRVQNDHVYVGTKRQCF